MKSMEQELVEDLAKEMQETMDFEVLSDVLCKCGWTRLEVDDYGFHRLWFEVMDWAKENCTGDFRERLGVWIFEHPQDATAFALKWL